MRALVLCVAVLSCVIHTVFAVDQPKSSARLQHSSSSSSEFISPINKAGSSTQKESTGPFSKLSFRNIPSQLANVRERIRQGAYNAAGVMYETAHPLREDIYRQAHNTAGAFYEAGDQTRKTLADHKQVKLGMIALKIYNQLELKGKTREEKVKVIVHAISEQLAKHVPLYTKIQPLEIKGNTKFVCGVKGLMRDLTTIKKVNTEIEKIQNDWLEIKIDYTFKDLHFNYTKFHVHGLGVETFQAKGSLDIKFHRNNVRLTIQIPTFSEIMKNLFLKRCIVHVRNFEVTELEFVKSTLSGRKDSKRRRYLSRKIKGYLSNNREFLLKKFEQRTLVEIHRALVTEGHWVCKDKDFGELVKLKGGRLEAFVPLYRDLFEKHCGTDYFIKPYQKPQAVEESDSSS